MPPWARRVIRSYWYDPLVEVVENLPGDHLSEINNSGFDIWFLGAACAKMPPPACVGLVLRQLAHVYRSARFERNRYTPIDNAGDVRKQREVDAVATFMFKWDLGVYVCLLRDWMKEQAKRQASTACH